MSIRTYRLRLFFLGALSLLVFLLILARLYYVQIVCHEEYAESARGQQYIRVRLLPRRGDILDRNGIILATSHFSNNILLDTAKFILPPKSALVRELAEIVQTDEVALRDLFDRPIRHVLVRDPSAAIRRLIQEAIPHYVKEYKMPAGALAIEPAGGIDVVVLDASRYVIQPNPRMIRELSGLFRKPEETIRGYFDRPRRYILARMAAPELEDQFRQSMEIWHKAFGVPREAFLFEQNGQRENPKDSLACHVIGYTNIDDNGDNIGMTGVERVYDKYLKGSVTSQTLPATQSRKSLRPLSEDVIEATYGNDVVLSVDEQIQMFTEDALFKRVGEVQARGGIAIVMDVRNGEILALASCPDFNLNDYGRSEQAQLRNRALTDPIEIGSVMKIITTTLLLDKGLVTPDEPIDCQGGRGMVRNRRLTDSHHLGVVPFREAFAASSNVGLATVGVRLDPPVYYAGLKDFGLGRLTGIDLPGEGAGILRPLEQWTELTRTSLPIGYETSLTAMEVIAALGAIGNDGRRLRPHVVREIRTHKGALVKRFGAEQIGPPVAGAQTCRTVRELMKDVVTLAIGTGTKYAQVPGYDVGGKTGTTVKTPPGVTPKKYIASFAGLLPIQNPRLAIYIYVDEPSTGLIYGAEIAGPVFRQIALRATHILGIPPDDPTAYAQIEKELASDILFASTSATLPQSADLLVAQADELTTQSAELREAAFQETTTAEEMLLPRMPDCRGCTTPETWEVLEAAGITNRVKPLGSGLVLRQEPASGAPVRPSDVVTLIFALPSETTGKPRADSQ